MAGMSDLVLDSRLDTRFHPNYVCHVYQVSDTIRGRRAVVRREYWQRIKHLGTGGFGSVYKEQCVKGSREGELRAVKEIRRPSPKTECNRELEAIAKFSHARYARCFVKSFGWYEQENTLYLAMEYFPRGDLQTYIEDTPQSLPETEAQQITFQILEGLGFMHSNGFAHRDMKPANILIQDQPPNEWWVKVTDFGLSKRFQESQAAPSGFKGTLNFMAPELHDYFAPGTESQTFLPKAADMWALGIISHLLLTKKFVFRSPRAVQRYTEEQQSFPDDYLRQHGVSSAASTFIQAVMMASPQSRPTAEQALRSEWLKDLLPSPSPVVEQLELPELPDLFSAIDLDASAVWSTEDSNILDSSTVEDSSFSSKGTTAETSVRSSSLSTAYDSHTALTSRKVVEDTDSAAKQKRLSRRLAKAIDTSTSNGTNRSTSIHTRHDVPRVATIHNQATTAATQYFDRHTRENGGQRPEGGPGGRRVFKYYKTFRELCKCVKGKNWEVNASKDSNLVAFSQLQKDNTYVRIFNVESKCFEGSFQTQKNHGIEMIAFDPKHRRLACGHTTGKITVWTYEGKRLLTIDDNHTRRIPIEHVDFGPEGKWLISIKLSCAPKIWSLDTGKSRLGVLDCKEVHDSISVLDFGTSFDSKLLAITQRTTSGEYQLDIVDIARNNVRATMPNLTEDVCGLEFSRDSKYLAYCQKSSITVWDITSNQLRYQLSAGGLQYEFLVFNHDSTIMLVGYQGNGNEVFHFWELETETRYDAIGTCNGYDELLFVDFTPDNTLIGTVQQQTVTGEWEMNIFELASPEDIKEIMGNELANKKVSTTAYRDQRFGVLPNLDATVSI